jgi:hypothetical protein
MLAVMKPERITVSLDTTSAARVRQCAARDRRGASGYIERLVRADAMAEAVANAERWHRAHPSYAEDVEAELAAAEGEA